MTFTQWHRNHSCDYGTLMMGGTLFTQQGLRYTRVQDCGYKMGIDVSLADWLKQLSIQ